MIVVDTSVFIDAHFRNAILVSNDKFQVDSALKFGIKAFYLLEEWQELNKLLIVDSTDMEVSRRGRLINAASCPNNND
ncbi:hypothetical protein X802_04080 [Thermococcus guaymasensis DSM 11113]|uniref:PIN domain-containing protein n=1 Tax=Thermococcus guaymasensis DSM 11113 TaxID=1432656 RepID=A0A0X1KN38_9EURY|nr:hypothetical protein [Thermococcus guaymasensis]AJC72702.1 hypothetical protein X802_04080 [Thermococcus guaymasensis DSM 11113]